MSTTIENKETEFGNVIIERPAAGQPHKGKVLAAVQPHADDIPLFCGGTIAKFLAEGYTGYLIQTTNDEKCGPTSSIGETILSNEREVDELAKVLGLKQVFNPRYRNHRLDEASPLELRARLVFLFRMLKVDTVFTFNPWGHSEENPDHYVTAQAVEAARWMAGMGKDYPEQVALGICAPYGDRAVLLGRASGAAVQSGGGYQRLYGGEGGFDERQQIAGTGGFKRIQAQGATCKTGITAPGTGW